MNILKYKGYNVKKQQKQNKLSICLVALNLKQIQNSRL